jgi:lysophospholipase L1-like esterase
MWMILAAGAFCAQAIGAASAQNRQFTLKDGDTVVFYGDSITAQRLYTRYVEDFLLTRYPTLHFRFVNAGVPGDSVRGGYAGTMEERVRRDVAPFRPTMITVMLGMNDGGWGTGSEQIDAAFQKGYRALLDELQKASPGASITLIGCTPYDEITHGTEFPGYSHVVARNADDVSSIGAQLQASGRKNILLADFHHPLTEALERAKTQFPQLAPLMVPDRIHPAETGHWIMAAALVSAWHVDPIVSSLALNASSAQVIDSDRTKVAQIEKAKDGLSWTQLDEALPLPLDFNNAMTPLLLHISEIERVDRQILRIDALEGERYQLLIDDKPIARFTREELRNGVNLALYRTPMLDQARGIAGMEDQRATLDQARFMLSADIKPAETSALAEARLRQAQEELDTSMRHDLLPQPHHFELRRQ